jgi:hypothetical protein
MKGPKAFIANHIGEFISMDCLEFFVNLKRSHATRFLFNGVRLEYFFHSYNNFRLTERTIEIPIVGYYLKKIKPEEILEIGNVSSHYYDYFRELFKKPIDIVDKYEKGFNVQNRDICLYEPHKKFDFIFSISTFEHMDEDRKNQNGSSFTPETCYALENMKYVVQHLLKPGCSCIITIPAGQNPEFDRRFAAGELKNIPCKSMNIFLFRRIRELQWMQIPLKDTSIPKEPQTSGDTAFSGVNSLIIIEIVAREEPQL